MIENYEGEDWNVDPSPSMVVDNTRRKRSVDDVSNDSWEQGSPAKRLNEEQNDDNVTPLVKFCENMK